VTGGSRRLDGGFGGSHGLIRKALHPQELSRLYSRGNGLTEPEPYRTTGWNVREDIVRQHEVGVATGTPEVSHAKERHAQHAVADEPVEAILSKPHEPICIIARRSIFTHTYLCDPQAPKSFCPRVDVSQVFGKLKSLGERSRSLWRESDLEGLRQTERCIKVHDLAGAPVPPFPRIDAEQRTLHTRQALVH
jgi:hypothetical protein